MTSLHQIENMAKDLDADLKTVLANVREQLQQRASERCELSDQGLSEDDLPASTLRHAWLHALAYTITVAEMHCAIAHKQAEEGDSNSAHAWSVDEGMLKGAIQLISSAVVP